MEDGKLSKAEQEAIKERAAELKASKGRKKKTREDAQIEVLEKISEMPAGDKQIALGLHEIVMSNFESLWPRVWYGMPAYTLDGKVLVFLSVSSKWDTRYSTLSFEDKANLDDGEMWSTGFAIKNWSDEVGSAVEELILKALN
jgi:uncharacterized protein YdhG (YjbR/CyaY superfamily)